MWWGKRFTPPSSGGVLPDSKRSVRTYPTRVSSTNSPRPSKKQQQKQQQRQQLQRQPHSTDEHVASGNATIPVSPESPASPSLTSQLSPQASTTGAANAVAGSVDAKQALFDPTRSYDKPWLTGGQRRSRSNELVVSAGGPNRAGERSRLAGQARLRCPDKPLPSFGSPRGAQKGAGVSASVGDGREKVDLAVSRSSSAGMLAIQEKADVCIVEGTSSKHKVAGHSREAASSPGVAQVSGFKFEPSVKRRARSPAAAKATPNQVLPRATTRSASSTPVIPSSPDEAMPVGSPLSRSPGLSGSPDSSAEAEQSDKVVSALTELGRQAPESPPPCSLAPNLAPVNGDPSVQVSKEDAAIILRWIPQQWPSNSCQAPVNAPEKAEPESLAPALHGLLAAHADRAQQQRAHRGQTPDGKAVGSTKPVGRGVSIPAARVRPSDQNGELAQQACAMPPMSARRVHQHPEPMHKETDESTAPTQHESARPSARASHFFEQCSAPIQLTLFTSDEAATSCRDRGGNDPRMQVSASHELLDMVSAAKQQAGAVKDFDTFSFADSLGERRDGSPEPTLQAGMFTPTRKTREEWIDQSMTSPRELPGETPREAVRRRKLQASDREMVRIKEVTAQHLAEQPVKPRLVAPACDVDALESSGGAGDDSPWAAYDAPWAVEAAARTWQGDSRRFGTDGQGSEGLRSPQYVRRSMSDGSPVSSDQPSDVSPPAVLIVPSHTPPRRFSMPPLCADAEPMAALLAWSPVEPGETPREAARRRKKDSADRDLIQLKTEQAKVVGRARQVALQLRDEQSRSFSAPFAEASPEPSPSRFTSNPFNDPSRVKPAKLRKAPIELHTQKAHEPMRTTYAKSRELPLELPGSSVLTFK